MRPKSDLISLIEAYVSARLSKNAKLVELATPALQECIDSLYATQEEHTTDNHAKDHKIEEKE